MKKNLHAIVTGKVQGVYFRSWVFDQAQSLGIKGWARNLQDGKVEILGQGEEAALKDFRERLLEGSPLSQVENVEANWTDYDKEYTEFEIRG